MPLVHLGVRVILEQVLRTGALLQLLLVLLDVFLELLCPMRRLRWR